MKCLECGNTSKFYEPVFGYRILSYINGKLSDTDLDNIERDSEKLILCSECEGKVKE